MMRNSTLLLNHYHQMSVNRRRFLTNAIATCSVPVVMAACANSKLDVAHAIDHAPDGGVVRIPAEVYEISESILIDDRKNLTIIADPGARLQSSFNNPQLIIAGSSNISIIGLTFAGAGIDGPAEQTGIRSWKGCENIYVERCKFLELGHDAVNAVGNVDGFRVFHCYIDGCGDDGINPGGEDTPQGTSHSIVLGNIIKRVKNDGVHVSDRSINTVVSANVVDNCGAGIGFYRAAVVNVADNILLNSRVAGIRLVKGPCGLIHITNNIIRSTPIGIIAEPGWILNGNIFVNVDQETIRENA